jgi:hypothetical protein
MVYQRLAKVFLICSGHENPTPDNPTPDIESRVYVKRVAGATDGKAAGLPAFDQARETAIQGAA